ncbi:glycerol 2-dehydrogenase (NAD+) [Breznakia blatticola]|uniref:Glycerol 2-dehydrogenase (NAD+) n=1 Tax=Breznakia blatticola TaxID=1754012 RepID=A0A4V3G999_9FIRM|nr:glycerol dehydrogenase [Breznakia blatticola]TDW26044.1 glycerol 2-dehydrogenase (NAD+) [Breznakia blatticola]
MNEQMNQVLRTPSNYLQGINITLDLSNVLELSEDAKILIIVDTYTMKDYRQRIEKSLDTAQMFEFVVFEGLLTMERLEVIVKEHEELDYDMVLGFGGGTIMDVAKAVSTLLQTTVVLVPSIASTDGPCSRLSAIYHEDGGFSHYMVREQSPEYVIVDLYILSLAPVRTFIAGIGDALSTYVEANACYLSMSVNDAGGLDTFSSLMIARSCKEIIFEDAVDAVKSLQEKMITPSFKRMIEANIYLSGIGFESGGLSIAHALHNGLTKLRSERRFMHGEVIAYTTLVQLATENSHEFTQYRDLCLQLGLPTKLADFGLTLDEKVKTIIEQTCFFEGSSMYHVPYEISPEIVFQAMEFVEKRI